MCFDRSMEVKLSGNYDRPTAGSQGSFTYKKMAMLSKGGVGRPDGPSIWVYEGVREEIVYRDILATKMYNKMFHKKIK